MIPTGFLVEILPLIWPQKVSSAGQLCDSSKQFCGGNILFAPFDPLTNQLPPGATELLQRQFLAAVLLADALGKLQSAPETSPLGILTNRHPFLGDTGRVHQMARSHTGRHQ